MWILTLAVLSLFIASSNGDETKVCGGTFQEDGVISIPDPFDARYRNKSMTCIWHYEAPKSQKVVLKISKYTLARAHTCAYVTDADHIQVYDGIKARKEKRLAILCSQGQELVISSTGNSLTVKMKTKRFNENSFIANTVFTYPVSVGCGGNINLETNSSYTLKAPEVADYKNGDVFECLWNFVAPEEHAIKVKLSLFKDFTCKDNNKLEILDGHAPDSLVLAYFCGEKLPPVVVSSSNILRLRLSSSKKSLFTANLSSFKSACSPKSNSVRDKDVTTTVVSVASGNNCCFDFRSNVHILPVKVSIKNLDIRTNTESGKCDSDKLILRTRSGSEVLDKYFSLNNQGLQYLTPMSKLHSLFGENLNTGQQYEICGQKSVEFYFRRIPFEDRLFLNIITAPGSSKLYKDFQVDISYPAFCKQNYTEPYGRIINNPDSTNVECYQLITAPESYTISLYFMSYEPVYSNSSYIEVYDGKTTKSTKIFSTYLNENLTDLDIPAAIFSNSNYLLIKTNSEYEIPGKFDLIYTTTNKGQGCGGYYYGDQGVVTSPLYPETYVETKSCEWVLETPVPTRLRIIFDEFDLKGDCKTNYVELIDRQGNVLSRFCSEKPGVYTSNDNFVKIVSVTGSNNSGKGWTALFGAV